MRWIVFAFGLAIPCIWPPAASAQTPKKCPLDSVKVGNVCFRCAR